MGLQQDLWVERCSFRCGARQNRCKLYDTLHETYVLMQAVQIVLNK